MSVKSLCIERAPELVQPYGDYVKNGKKAARSYFQGAKTSPDICRSNC